MESCCTLKELVDNASLRYSDKILFTDKTDNEWYHVSYKEFKNQCISFANLLISLELSKKNIAFMCKASYKSSVCIFGSFMCGSCVVPMDSSYSVHELQNTLTSVDVQAIIYDNEFYDQICHLEQCCPQIKHMINLENWNEQDFETTLNQFIDPKPQDLACIIFTSGTTGKSKAVMLTHNNLVKNAWYSAKQLGLTNQRLLSVIPLHHVFFILQLNTSILTGSEISFNKNKAELFKDICQYQTSFMFIVPLLAESIYEYFSKAYSTNQKDSAITVKKRLLGENLKYLICGSAKLDAALIQKYKQIGILLLEGYGITEASPCISGNTPSMWKPGSLGKPIPNFQVKIVDGEIWAKSECIMQGYYNNIAETNQAISDGWLKTGDLGYLDEEGYIYIIGRKKNLIILNNGENVSPEEIENKILMYDVISEVCISAEKEEIIAEVFCENTAKLSDSDLNLQVKQIIEEVNNLFPVYKKVHEFKIRKEKFRRNTMGKILRDNVQEKTIPMVLQGDSVYLAPRYELECKLCKLFEKSLENESIGVYDNFFSLGGNSFKAALVIFDIQSELDVKVTISEFFNNPTIDKLALLIKSKMNCEHDVISKASQKTSYPMSSVQKRMFIIQESDKKDVTYNLPYYFRIDGQIDIEKMNHVFQQIVNRHESLRTTFHIENGEYVQKIVNKYRVHMDVVCESNSEETNIEDLFEKFIEPFDLGSLPLMRVKILKMSNELFYLFIDIHHIIFDGASVEILINEFNRLYRGETLEPLKFHYKDYSEWFQNRDFKDQQLYWKAALGKELQPLELPLDYTRPTIHTHNGSFVQGSINSEVIIKIHRFNDTTEYMVLLATFLLLLSKYSRQEEIIVGSVISGRTMEETRNMIGMFVNTIVLKSNIDKDKTFIEILRDIKTMCLSTYENQEYPYEKLVEDLDVKKDLSRNPLFDVMFVMQNNNEMFDIPETKISKEKYYTPRSKFDLTMEIVPEKTNYTIHLEYCSDLFKREFMELFLVHYLHLLEQVINQPEKKISQIEMITPEEDRKIRTEFNQTYVKYPDDKTVVDLFEEQVERIPDETAVVSDGQSLSYRDLNAKANQLAGKIRSFGVGPNDYVTIITERKFAMIIGIYGILKAGGAYVPVDPENPAERIHYILNDCKPKVILTGTISEELQELIEELGIPRINLNDSSIYSGSCKNLIKVNQPDDLIYVIYTSGTTGRPKGVMNRHCSLVNRILWMNRRFSIHRNSVVLMKTTYTFDVSVYEILSWAFSGARLVLLSPGGEKDPKEICRVIHQYGVTVLHFVPSMLGMFLTYLESNLEAVKDIESVAYFLSSGEALGIDHLKRFNSVIKATNERTHLINLYGPTEAAIDVTYYECSDDSDYIPIGTPIDNTQIYIVQDNKLCGFGVPGELCIGGVQLARGYLNMDTLTKEKFIVNPFGKGRLYRTGDLAKQLSDGNIVYLGRLDEQVKLRGYRIELPEIENVIRKQEGVKAAAVIIRESKENKDLNAYIVADRKIDVNELKTALKLELPDYMVPVYMKQIDKLPLTGNGKLDKRALPIIELETAVQYEAPRNEKEEVLVYAVEKILGVRNIGVNDNFFDMGGDSLKATILVNQLRESNYHINVGDIMRSATIENMAQKLLKI